MDSLSRRNTVTPLQEAMAEPPHPIGDECRGCGEEGWHKAKHAINSLTGDEISVAEGYGNFKGYILVAKGHRDDQLGSIAPDHFRSKTVVREVHAAGSLLYQLVSAG